MQLDDRAGEVLERIEDRNRGVCISCRIDNDASSYSDGLLDPVDELTFVVGLAEADFETHAFRPLLTGCLDLAERRRAIDLRLTRAEKVQVGAVQNIDGLGHRSVSSRESRGGAAVDVPFASRPAQEELQE